MIVEVSYQSHLDLELKKTISDLDTNLVYVKRTIPLWLSSVVSIIKKTKKPYQFWSVKKDIITLREDLSKSLNHFNWEDDKIKQQFINEICHLADVFVKLTNYRTPFISLRTIDEQYFKVNKKDVSQNFHIDTSTLTLICTYCGKGTIWIENKNICREAFKLEKMPSNSDLYHNGIAETFNTMKVFDIALIKGEIRNNEESNNLEFILNFISKDEIEEFNIGNGLVHAGPGYTEGDEKRMLVTISTMKIPHFLKYK